jgi:hypothetical protein
MEMLPEKEKGFTTEDTEEEHRGHGDGGVIWDLVAMGVVLGFWGLGILD